MISFIKTRLIRKTKGKSKQNHRMRRQEARNIQPNTVFGGNRVTKILLQNIHQLLMEMESVLFKCTE